MVKIEQNNDSISLKRKCELLDINRSRIYYEPEPIDQQDIIIMNEIRNIYEATPFYGYRRVHVALSRLGYSHNRKKTQRLMRLTGLQTIYPRKKTTIRNTEHKVYPYLLEGLNIDHVNQVWAVDITYIKLGHGFGYLVCLIDLFSRRIMGWSFSSFLDTKMCLEAYEKAIKIAKPEIINSDHGCQFTSHLWTQRLISDNVRISMDGKGRWIDNVYIERLWRSIKYESVYLHSFESMEQAKLGLAIYIDFYNKKRFHQSLNYKTPDEQYFDNVECSKSFVNQLNKTGIIKTNGGAELSQIQANFLS